MIEYSLLILFFSSIVAGTITVFLPCTYPMVLGYIALMLGDRHDQNAIQVFRSTLWFFVGFAIIFILFGSIAGLFGQFSSTALAAYSVKPILVTVGGILLILIGLVLLRAVPLPEKLRGIRSLPLPNMEGRSGWKFGIAGSIFAAGWSPCIGPVLGGILVLAASSESVFTGALLLLAFSVGMMVPFLILAVAYTRIAGRLHRMEKIIPAMRIIGGLLFIFLGIFFITGHGLFLGQIQPPEFLIRYI